MEKNFYDIGIIGAGPAGYTLAIRAAQKGLKVVIFEKENVGGVCLNKGCLPTKTIINSSELFKKVKNCSKYGIFADNAGFDYEKIFERKNNVVEKIRKSLRKLIESYGIEIVNADATVVDGKIFDGEMIYECKNIVLALGSQPSNLGDIVADGEFVLNSDDILNLKELPKNILIVGSGAIGTEWARIFSSLTVETSVIEIADKVLPAADSDVSDRLERLLKRQRVKILTSTKIEKIAGEKVYVRNLKCENDDCKILEPEMILLAAGRKPCEAKIDGLEFSGKFVKVDENFKTNLENVYAIGDMTGKIQLAHSAIHQAIGLADFLTEGKSVHFDENLIPSVIYGEPEIAWIGMSEQNLKADNIDYNSSTFPIAALGKAQADDELDGFVKILSNQQTRKILGAHIVSKEASSLVAQIVLAMQNNLSIDEITQTTFAHPTYSEGIFEALLGLDKMSLHLPPA